MPVREILSFSPILPIVMRYTEAQVTHIDQDSIVALLELPSCLREIRLSVTTSLLAKVTTLMQQPFSPLEYLHLSTQDNLVLPREFGSDIPHLRALRMDGFGLPSLPRLLLSAHSLASLQLEKIPGVGYTLEALIVCLPSITQLETLLIRFLSPTLRGSRPVLSSTDWSLPGSSVLPVLNFIEFHGTSEYLESLLSGISAPRLERFHIDFFNQLVFDAPQLSRFISRSEIQQSSTHATIHSSFAGISITLTQLGVPHQLSLRLSCTQLDWQIPFMAEVCDKLSLTLADVEQLKISAFTSFLGEKDDMDLIHSEILELFRPFRHVKRLCITEASLPLVSGALGRVTGEQLLIVELPELQEIQTETHAEVASARKKLAPFIAARNRSLHPVVLRGQYLFPSLLSIPNYSQQL